MGETGTGKELAAREIHACSARASGPFVALNCGAIPKDLFETEFFGYKKGAFTGANRLPEQLVRDRLFREDLYFRLNVYTIHMPPLRERPQDILVLAAYFMNHFNIRFGKNFRRISPQAKHLAGLISFPLPEAPSANIRLTEQGVDLEELEKNLIRQALDMAHGNKAKAARLLRMSSPTLYYRLEKYGL
jgi:transcriptional regulator with PAS, ATPase and Fis domain